MKSYMLKQLIYNYNVRIWKQAKCLYQSPHLFYKLDFKYTNMFPIWSKVNAGENWMIHAFFSLL